MGGRNRTVCEDSGAESCRRYFSLMSDELCVGGGKIVPDFLFFVCENSDTNGWLQCLFY